MNSDPALPALAGAMEQALDKYGFKVCLEKVTVPCGYAADIRPPQESEVATLLCRKVGREITAEQATILCRCPVGVSMECKPPSQRPVPEWIEPSINAIGEGR